MALLAELVRRSLPLASVTVYEPRDELGTGVAYGDAPDSLLLNTRSAAMGVCAEAPGGFADWAGLAGGDRWGFATRRHYAAYIQHCLDRDLRRAAFPLLHRRERVTGLSRWEPGFVLRSPSGAARFDAVVLAIGAPAPPPLAALHPDAASDPRYVEQAWSSDWLAQLQPDDHVVVLGTGLTTVDQLQRLRDAGHCGIVTAVSRRGQLPQAHAPQPQPADAPWEAAAGLPLRVLLRTLRRQLRDSAGWRDMLDALRPQHRAIWSALDSRERRAFMRHLRPWWDTHRHRMPPAAAALVQQARAEGRLRIMAGSVVAITPDEGRLAVSVRPRGRDDVCVLKTDTVVRATGFGLALEAGRDPLLDTLLQAGLLHPDPLGLGACADGDCRILDARGLPVPGLYALGPLLAGRWWEATAVPDIRQDAGTLAQALAGTVPGDAR